MNGFTTRFAGGTQTAKDTKGNTADVSRKDEKERNFQEAWCIKSSFARIRVDSRKSISGQRRIYPQIAWISQIHIGIPPSPFPIPICVIGEIGGLLLSRAKVGRIGGDDALQSHRFSVG